MRNNDCPAGTSALSRRRFLALGALTSAGMAFAPDFADSIETKNGNLLYSSDFVPGGALFKFAVVADHHFWPNHQKNWDEKEMRHTEERMRDLVELLNLESPELSIHCGDLINAGTAFEPPHDEYIRQLDYEKTFLDSLRHPAIPLIGNHEVPDVRYESESELDEWKKRFGPLYRSVDVHGWRMVCLNMAIPSAEWGLACGIEGEQLRWLGEILEEAASKSMRALLFCHYPPAEFTRKSNFEQVVNATGCVRGMFCGHMHANSRAMLGNVPVLLRASNAASPLAYSMIHVYPDNRILVVQKSLRLPFDNFLSNAILPGLQGKEEERYCTLDGSTELPLNGLKVVGENASAVIRDGHLTFRSEKGRGYLLIDTPALQSGRIRFTMTKEKAVRMGVFAGTGPDFSRRVEAVITSEFGPDGDICLASCSGAGRKTLDRTWFNIADGIAYETVFEIRKGKAALSIKNAAGLKATVGNDLSGQFGLFVEGGAMIVTDLSLERA